MSADTKKRAVALVGTIDEGELAIRTIEAMGGFKRPHGFTYAQVKAVTPPEVMAGAHRVARACLSYIAECLKDGVRPQ